jgi:hypothetical protein
MSKLPEIIQIGAQEFTISQRSKKEDGMLNEGAYGYTLETENLIVIDADIHVSKKRVTVIHEIMHAIRLINDSPIKPKKEDEFEDVEHYFISMWEANLIQVLRDNPKLKNWIFDDEK